MNSLSSRILRLLTSVLIICGTIQTIYAGSPMGSLGGRSLITGMWHGKSVTFADGLIAMKIGQSTPEMELSSFASKTHVTIVNPVDKLGWMVIDVGRGIDVVASISAFSTYGFIELMEPVFTIHVSYTPNDPYFSNQTQWALTSTTAGIDIQAAWDITVGDPSVKIAILDTGIPLDENGELNHEDLDNSTRILLGNDYADDGDGVKDANGHGTHVAGIIGAETGNSLGIAGVASGATMLIEQVFTSAGDGLTSWFYYAVRHAVDQGCKVINFSGGVEENVDSVYLAAAAVQYANDSNVVLVAAAGNGSPLSTIAFPARSSSANVIAVGATTDDGTRATYSRYGSALDVMAPGGNHMCGAEAYNSSDIYSTFPTYYVDLIGTCLNTSYSYSYLAGTSMATPYVTGLAALILSVNQNLSPSEVRQAIELSATPLSQTVPNNYTGWGRTDAYRALKYVIENFSTTLGREGKTVVFNDDISIASGTTLIIQAGTTVKFASGKHLIVNGALIAEGTSSDPIIFESNAETPNPGDWYGITLNGGPNTLQYCTIQHAQNGLEVKNSSTNLVENCVIQNCSTNGILGYNTLPNGTLTIQNSTSQNNARGVALSYSRADLASVTLTGNSWQGIYGTNSSACYSTGSNIHDNGTYGAYFTGYNSFLTLGGTSCEAGYNTIYNNSTSTEYSNLAECTCSSDATAYIGWYDCGDEYWGRNNIYHGPNTAGGAKLVINNTSQTVMAQLTYWADTASTGFEGPVVYSHSSPTSYGLFKVSSPAVATGSAGSPLTQDPKTSRLIVKLLDIVRSGSDSSAAALPLLATFVGSPSGNSDIIPGGWIQFLNSTIASTKNTHLRESALACLFDATAADRDPAGTISLADSLMINAGDALWSFCQVKKIAANLDAGNVSACKDELAGLVSDPKNMDAETMRFLQELLAMREHSLGFSASNGKIAMRTPVGKIDSSPRCFDLMPNYPNPFNPSTVIEYQMPVAGNVKVVVFDVLGRQIAELASGVKQAGSYSVKWDASSVASGVYYARFVVTDDIGNVKYAKVNKLLLMK